MKKMFLGALVLVALLAGSWTTPRAAAAPADVQVTIENYAFKTPTLTIPAGTAVVWTNKDDDPHTVTADDRSFDSKGLGQGDTFRYVFAQPGKYPYHCSAHPFMKGVVIVQEAKT